MNSNDYSDILSIQNADIFKGILSQYDAQYGQFPTPKIQFDKLLLAHVVNAGGFLNPMTTAFSSGAITLNGVPGVAQIPNGAGFSLTFGDPMPDSQTVRRSTFQIFGSLPTAGSSTVTLSMGTDLSNLVNFAGYPINDGDYLNFKDMLVLPGWILVATVAAAGAGDNVFIGGLTHYANAGVEVPK